MADIDQTISSSDSYEDQLRAANEIVYKHSLELARLKQALEIANAQQENLLHFISHEIKGYLTKSEAGFAAIVEGDYGAVPPQLQEMARTALHDVRKGVATVMDILDASNLKKGTVAFKKTLFDFKAAVLAIVAEQKSAAYEKHLGLDVNVAEGKYAMGGDEGKIREHVVRNLIDNAIRYTPAGTIRIELSDGDGKIHFSIQDSGVGITPEDMAHLFTEGGHGKDSIKVNVHSTGYGLFIAKQIVEAHGGTIWAESEGIGKGAKFIVEFPAA
jgi:signal transduction histidine kinase